MPLLAAVASVIVFLLPSFAHAAVRINEVMYDLEGTDTDREWIEVINDGATAIDIASFKLFEANTSHSLSAVAGSTVLQPGGVAVIAAVPSKFLEDWPAFTGALLDSAFSLSNSGEALGIKNGAGADEDSVSYTSSMGAQGDGKSLGRSGASFSPQTPSPGSSGAHTPAPSSENNDDPPAQSASAVPQTIAAPAIKTATIYAGSDRALIVGAGSVFSADVYGTEGKLVPDARVLWNFGNGEAKEGRSVEALYRYPGRYAVTVTGVVGEYSGTTRFIVEARPASVELRVETDGSVSVLNTGARDLDVSLWQVERAGFLFRFPRGTTVLSGEGVRLPPGSTGIPLSGAARLLYPNGEEAAPASAVLERIPASASKASASVAAVRNEKSKNVAPAEQQLPPEERVSASPYQAAAAAAMGPETGSGESGSLWLWLSGALALSVLGAAALALTRLVPEGKEQADDAAALADKEAEEYRLL